MTSTSDAPSQPEFEQTHRDTVVFCILARTYYTVAMQVKHYEVLIPFYAHYYSMPFIPSS